jgi:hypothetical protein
MSSGAHNYYDWQVSTLLLAYDSIEPLARDDEGNLARRQQAVEEELRRLVHEVLPEDYKQNPQREFPPEVVILLTRATLRRAASIIGLI